MLLVNNSKVELLDSMGSDLSVANCARVSFDKQVIEFTEKEAKLIHYLAEHKHWTPFGHCFASFRISAPIFVARQLGKHQVGLVWNEVSRRYVDSEPSFYSPNIWREKAANVKQGSGGTHADSNSFSVIHDEIVRTIGQLYLDMVKEGICPEQARMVLPQSMMTEWIWSGSIAAFARVCKLRLDPHTQKETQEVAKQIDNLLAMVYPCSWSALMLPEN